jgi:hypothetical protein
VGNSSGNNDKKAKLAPLPPEKVSEILTEVEQFFDDHPELNLASPESLQKFAHRLLMAEWVRNVVVTSDLALSEEQTSSCVEDLCEGLTESVLRDPQRLSDHLDEALGMNGLVFMAGKWRKVFES